jgi:hypothetical protein
MSILLDITPYCPLSVQLTWRRSLFFLEPAGPETDGKIVVTAPEVRLSEIFFRIGITPLSIRGFEQSKVTQSKPKTNDFKSTDLPTPYWFWKSK